MLIRHILIGAAGVTAGWMIRRRYDEGKGVLREYVDSMMPGGTQTTPRIPVLRRMQNSQKETNWDELDRSLINVSAGG